MTGPDGQPRGDRAAGDPAAQPGHGFRFVEHLGDVARDAGALLFNRLELAAIELSEVRGALLRLLLVGALAVVAIWFAVAGWTALAIYLAWPAMGWTILLVVALLFSLLGWLLLRRARAMVEEGRLSMPATMAELRSDRDALR